MQKDWKTWTVYINRHSFSNWAFGIDYYHEYEYIPIQLVARICQINLLFFNITITRWSNDGWI